MYPESAIERVLLVQRALRIGFTLGELAEVLKTRDSGGAPCRRVFEIAQEKLKGIEADIEALKSTRKYLKKVLSDWQGRMNQLGPGQRAQLLQSLTSSSDVSGRNNRFRRKSRP
jgi:DNA-binding transcriptional MerR regulator